MNSFEIIYEAEEDVLEVTFDSMSVDESLSRAIALNEEIVLHTDALMSAAWGITFYSYARLLQVTETHLDELEPLDTNNRNRVLAMLLKEPVSKFLEILDTEQLRALVKAPRISELF